MINPEILKTKEGVDLLTESLKRRGIDFRLEKLLEFDVKRRRIQTEIDKLRAEKNKLTDEFAKRKREKEQQDLAELTEKIKNLNEKIEKLEAEQRENNKNWREQILSIPNIPDKSVPETEPLVVKEWGLIKIENKFSKPHWEIGEQIGILDFERGASLSASGFTVLYSEAALLERALINFMIDVHAREHGYTEIFAPYLVKEEVMIGTGQLPKFKDDLYVTDDGLYLIPTSEVTLVNICRNKIISENSLPLKFVSYSACFRKEAGTWGRETRGMTRQHQFNKVELVKITTPEESYSELESLVDDACDILRRLNLPHRVILLPANDMGFASAKTFDIEVWLPGQKKFLEISSCSNCEDFQSRRSMIRIRRRKSGKTEYAHTLNGSGVAIGRCLIAILENYYQSDGTVRIPEPLLKYTGIEKIENVKKW